jgi:hypothetical protein
LVPQFAARDGREKIILVGEMFVGRVVGYAGHTPNLPERNGSHSAFVEELSGSRNQTFATRLDHDLVAPDRLT